MRLFYLPLLTVLLAGCFTLGSSSEKPKESTVDAELAQGTLASIPPEAGPGLPQKSFDQEVNQSR